MPRVARRLLPLGTMSPPFDTGTTLTGSERPAGRVTPRFQGRWQRDLGTMRAPAGSVTADSIGAALTNLNTGAAFSRISSAWDPRTNTIVGPNVARTYTQVIGTTNYTATLIEKQSANGLTAGTSERFDRWTTTGTITVTADTTAAPDGDVIAQTLNDTDAAVMSSVSQALAQASSANTIPISIYVRKTSGGTAPTFGFTAALSVGTPVSVVARINTDTGAQQYGSNAQTTVVDASTNYWRVCLLLTDNNSGNTTLTISVFPAASAYGASVDSVSATGSCICTFAMKGNSSGSSSYVDSYASNRNLLLRTQELATTWVQTRCTITSDSTANPVNGLTDADTINEDNTNANTHFIGQSFTKANAAIQMTYSVYLKQSGRTWAFVQCSDTGLTNGAGIYFDLANGAKGTAVALGVGWTLDASSITSAGSGWYRCVITVTTAVSTTIRSEVFTATADLGAIIAVALNAAALIHWGSQLVYGASAMNYWAVSSAARRDVEALLATATFSTTAATFFAVMRPLGWDTDQGGNASPRVFSSGTTNTDARLVRSSSGVWLAGRADAGGSESTNIVTTFANGVSSSIAMTYDANAVTGYFNGLRSGTPDTSLTAPYNAVATIGIGYDATGLANTAGAYIVLLYHATIAYPPAYLEILDKGVVR